MFYHAYDAYMDHAYPWDELKPLTCEPRRWDRRDRGTLDDNLGGYECASDRFFVLFCVCHVPSCFPSACCLPPVACCCLVWLLCLFAVAVACVVVLGGGAPHATRWEVTELNAVVLPVRRVCCCGCCCPRVTRRSFALTQIDSLDMLALIGDYDEFRSAVARVQTSVTFNRNVTVSVYVPPQFVGVGVGVGWGGCAHACTLLRPCVCT